MKNFCIVAGDPSGDSHAARLVESIRKIKPDIRFFGLGGPKMKEAGVEILDELTKVSSIGPFDAAKHLNILARARKLLIDRLKSKKPDAVILVDFGDFNLPAVAPAAKKLGCRVLYYISPQIWAWGGFRMNFVKKYVDRMIVFFKFEEDFYRKHNVQVSWVGHPLMDSIGKQNRTSELFDKLGLDPDKKTIGLLPGSREKEIKRHLGILIESARQIARQMPKVQFLLMKAPGLQEHLFAGLRKDIGCKITACEGRMNEALSAMDAAIVCSGTATVQTALFGVPMAVVYRTSCPTYLAAKMVVRVKNIAMVNIILGKEAVSEFIQKNARPGLIAPEIISLLQNDCKAEKMRLELQRVKEFLGNSGAVERAARIVLDETKK